MSGDLQSTDKNRSFSIPAGGNCGKEREKCGKEVFLREDGGEEEESERLDGRKEGGVDLRVYIEREREEGGRKARIGPPQLAVRECGALDASDGGAMETSDGD